ncbi:MAG: hypothetical protein ACJ76H_00380 [Bacteriovoracaceae bacterium]|jgi:hypothetical protein
MFKALLLLVLFSGTANAWTVKWNHRLNWYNRYINSGVEDDSPLNPDNQVAKIPTHAFESDLRPTFNWELNGNQRFKVDPRLIFLYGQAEYKDQQNTTDKTQFFMNEVNWQGNFGDHQIALGIQNYQWGPAEMLSPTNPIFRFRFDQRSLFFQQRGRNLVRWNWQISHDWNLVTMVEVSKGNQQINKEDQDFQPNGLMKLERALEKSSDYIGVVAGKTPYAENFVGEYFAKNFTDEFSAYFDTRHQKGSNNWYPSDDPTALFFAREHNKGIKTLANVGVRYEGRVDFRIEYIYNGVGLDNNDWNKTLNALKTPGLNTRENFKRFYFSGRDDLQRQHYGYTSMRIPDLGGNNQYTVFLRHFRSLADSSALTQFQMDRVTGESFNLYLEASYYQGGPQTEFGALLRHEISAGFRYSL